MNIKEWQRKSIIQRGDTQRNARSKKVEIPSVRVTIEGQPGHLESLGEWREVHHSLRSWIVDALVEEGELGAPKLDLVICAMFIL